MPLTFKDAVRKMSSNSKLKFYYFFCEKGPDGKPVMLVDTKKMDPKKDGPAKEALGTAKAKGNSRGTMSLNEKRLSLKPQGASLPSKKLEMGVKLAANQSQVQALIQGVEVGEPEAEEPDKKEFSDPLRSDPTIAKLLDQRDQIRGKIEATIGDGTPGEAIEDSDKRKTLKDLQVKLQEVEGQLEEAQRQLGVKGFKTQALRSEYQGEDKKFGWRVEEATPRDQFKTEDEYQEYLKKREGLRDSDRRLTKYFTEQERKDSEVHFDEQGRAVGKLVTNLDGTVSGSTDVMQNKKVEYVMDQSGAMHQFQQKVVKTGEKMVSPVTGNTLEKDVATHHSSVLGGEDVVGAGEMELDYQGYLKKISNKSGHYKPGATQVIQLLEELARQGALLDKTYKMPGPDGKGKALEGKPKQIFEAVVKVEARVKQKIAEGKDPTPDLEAIRQAKEVLAKLGAAPANTFRDVEVEVIGGIEDKKGLDIRQDTGDISKAKKFLETGGGNKEQAGAKKDMLTQLKEKLAKKAQELDAEAEKLSQKVSGELRERVARLPETLKWYRAQLEEALQNNSEKGKALQASLMAGIKRIEAETKTTETSDQALGKVLEDLEEYLRKVTQDVGQVESNEGTFEVTENLAKKLGVSVSDLKKWADDNNGSLDSDVLVYKLGIDVDELNEKLKGKPQDKLQDVKAVNLDDDDDDDDDDDNEPQVELSLGEWLSQGFRITPEEAVQKLGVNLGDVQPLMDGPDMLYPMDLVNKLKLKAEDVYEKLTGKKPK